MIDEVVRLKSLLEILLDLENTYVVFEV